MNDLGSFIETVCSDSRLRVDEDFGGGFVRLKRSEAEKRQAAQDIRSTEDVVIECLRNARDAGARRIYVAVSRDEAKRSLVVVDDGCGVPENMNDRIFEPRVTSKLDSAHMDKWGMHGRGMALYSIRENAESAAVACSRLGRGTSIVIDTNLETLGEKTDQSTFPSFEVRDGVHVMRGPRNILRTCAEFALEHRKDCEVFCGSFTEIVAAMYEYGMATLTPVARALGDSAGDASLPQALAFAARPEDLAERSEQLGMVISTRSARRIMDGSIEPALSLVERLKLVSFPEVRGADRSSRANVRSHSKGLKLDAADVDRLSRDVSRAFKEIAERYFLVSDVKPEIRVSGDSIRITIPVEKML